MSSAFAYLLERLRDASQVDVADDRWMKEDVHDLALEVAEFVRDALDVPSLDRELIARSQIDIGSVSWLIDKLVAISLKDANAFRLEVGLGSGTFIDWESRLGRLRLVAESVKSPQQLDHLEVSLRLGLVADGAVDTLLAALPLDHPLKAEIEARLLPKLGLLPNDKAMAFWQELRFQVDPAREVHFEVDPAIAPKEFFDLGDVGQVRGRIARYLAVTRPALERQMSERGVHVIPAGLTGIATVLSWTKTPSTTDWTPRVRTAVRALCRMAALWQGSKDELAPTLGVPLEGYILGGRGEHEAKQSAPADTNGRSGRLRMLDELTKLVRIAEYYRVRVEGAVERTLRAFKLGLEVATEDVLRDARMKNELYLQRILLRFLVEREIPALGTKFGQSEVDIRAEDPIGAIVIETKVLKQALSDRTLNRWLTQLGSYMDQSHAALRGALVIFNYGNSPILAPIGAIRFRFLILVVNLCSATPSKRVSGIEIEENETGPDVVRLVRFGDDARTVARKARPRKRK
jgi:hypothetical protein